MTDFTITARYTAGDEQKTIHPDDYHTNNQPYTTFVWYADGPGIDRKRAVPTSNVVEIDQQPVQ